MTSGTRIRRVARDVAFSCALAATAFACSDDDNKDTTGTLVIPFELGNDRTCDDLGVKRVRASLDDGEHTKDAPCSNGQVRFTDLPAGTYHVEMFGEDADGDDILDSVQAGDVIVNVVGRDSTTVAK